ncbi:MAG: CopG family transcriptional regulator [Candidatus Omnitrophica bacterium]|nr:CopG family transcriptional regulator [Candidatus Omnitrophota bacterium]
MGRYPVSISFEAKELKQLDRLAKLFHQTRSAFLKAALADYVRKLEFERLHQLGSAIAQGKGYFTDEDIFRIVS